MTNAKETPPVGQPGTVYLIHLDKPYHHARHYLGWTTDLPARIENHATGTGSPLLRAANQAGITWAVVRTWDHVDRHFERRLKNWKSSDELCPICTAQKGN